MQSPASAAVTSFCRPRLSPNRRNTVPVGTFNETFLSASVLRTTRLSLFHSTDSSRIRLLRCSCWSRRSIHCDQFPSARHPDLSKHDQLIVAGSIHLACAWTAVIESPSGRTNVRESTLFDQTDCSSSRLRPARWCRIGRARALAAREWRATRSPPAGWPDKIRCRIADHCW